MYIRLDSHGNSELLESPRLEEMASKECIADQYWNHIWYFSHEGRFGLTCKNPIPKPNVWTRFWWNTTMAKGLVRFALDDPIPYELDEIRKPILDALPQDDDGLSQYLAKRTIKKLLARATDFDSMVLAIGCLNGLHEKESGHEYRDFLEKT